MPKQGDVFENPATGTRMEIRESSSQRVVFERRYPPGTGKADPHFHLDFVQSWEVMSGTATVGVDGETRRLEAGEKVEIPRETKHQDPYNESDGELWIRWQIEPCNEFVEGFLGAFTYLLTRDELNDQDEFPMLQLFVILRGTRAQSYAVSPPVPVQKATLPLLAAIGRLRGYKLRYANGGGSESRPT